MASATPVSASASLDRRAFVAGGVLLGAAALGAAPRLLSRSSPVERVDLAAIVPTRIGPWSLDTRVAPVLPDAATEATIARTYDQTLARVYRAGDWVMMLVIANGTQRSGTLAAHRPSTCYTAQGFAVTDERHAHLPPPFVTVDTARVFARQGEREEAIAYWITVDGERTGAGIAQKLRLFRASLEGRQPNGFLVRASTLGPDVPQSFDRVDGFLALLLARLPARERRIIAGIG